MKLPVALQLYSVREDLAKDFKGTIENVAELGYDGVEFAGLYGNDPKEIKELLKKNNLTALSAHVPINDLLADVEKCLGAYKEIGVQYVAIPWLDETRRPGHELFDQTLKDILMIAKKAKEIGITLLYHNHDFEFVKIDGEYALDILYKTIPADLLQTELDTCWVNVGGENPSDFIRKYTGRAPVVHLKDFIMPGKKPAKLYELIGVESKDSDDDGVFEFRPLGSGVQDFDSIIKASEEAGAKWIVVEQDNPSLGLTPAECAKASIEYLKKIYY